MVLLWTLTEGYSQLMWLQDAGTSTDFVLKKSMAGRFKKAGS